MSTTVTYKGSTLTTVSNETKILETAGTYMEDDVTLTDVSSSAPILQSKSVNYTPTESAQSQTVTADSGYDGLSSVAVSVAAMPTGTLGNPVAVKGTVSNHSVSVTPMVLTQAGYIASQSKTGTAVTVSASELVSGTKSIAANGTGIDVTDYEDVDVNVPNSYSASDEGKVVDNGALIAQTSTTFTQNGTYDTTTNDEVVVNVSGGGGAGAVVQDQDGYLVLSPDAGGGGISIDDIATNTAPSGAITLGSSVTQIGDYAFAGKPVTSVTGIGVTKINGNAFNGSSVVEITDSNFPNLNEFATSACAYMPSLLRVYLTGENQYLKNFYTFQNNNNSIKVARFPNCTGGTNQQNFGSCYQLKVIDLGPVNNISTNFAYNARGLQTLILRKTTVCAMANVSAFANTPLRGYNSLSAIVYIPKALYDHLGDGSSSDYRAATNWSTIYNDGHITFAQLEGSPYEQIDWDDSSFLS